MQRIGVQRWRGSEQGYNDQICILKKGNFRSVVVKLIIKKCLKNEKSNRRINLIIEKKNYKIAKRFN